MEWMDFALRLTVINQTIFLMGVHGSRNGYDNPKRIFFSRVFLFLFVWNLADHDN